MSAASVKAARELRDLVQTTLEARYARGTVAFNSRRVDHHDTAGLVIDVGGEPLELHVYANLEEAS